MRISALFICLYASYTYARVVPSPLLDPPSTGIARDIDDSTIIRDESTIIRSDESTIIRDIGE